MNSIASRLRSTFLIQSLLCPWFLISHRRKFCCSQCLVTTWDGTEICTGDHYYNPVFEVESCIPCYLSQVLFLQILAELKSQKIPLYQFPVDDETVRQINTELNVIRFLLCFVFSNTFPQFVEQKNSEMCPSVVFLLNFALEFRKKWHFLVFLLFSSTVVYLRSSFRSRLLEVQILWRKTMANRCGLDATRGAWSRVTIYLYKSNLWLHARSQKDHNSGLCIIWGNGFWMGRRIQKPHLPKGFGKMESCCEFSVENEEHCDFVKLREALLRTNVDALVERTHSVLYEQYRRERLVQMGVQDGETGPKMIETFVQVI